MIRAFIETRFALQPSVAIFVLMFFGYSFLGYILECIVLTVEKRHLVMNRGFVRRLPFCIIYGFGGMLGYALLSPLKGNLIWLFLVGALVATTFEYSVARLQMHFFGDFWWDYTEKPFNYKGVLCLESTIGWGFVSIIIVRFLHVVVRGIVMRIPIRLALPFATILLFAYALDFLLTARDERLKQNLPEFEVEYYKEKPANR